MTRRRRLAVVPLAAVLAAGCASHPERPTPATQTAAAAPTFHDCTVLFERAKPRSYILRCGTLLAGARRVVGAYTPAELIQGQLDSLAALSIGHVSHRPSPHPLVVEGLAHPATLVAIGRGAGDGARGWAGAVTAWRAGSHTTVVLTCGAKTAADRDRCPALFAWMARHDAAPSSLPRAHPRDKTPAEWSPTLALDAFPSCTGLAMPGGRLRLRCDDATVVLMRVAGHRGPVDALALAHLLGDLSRQMLPKIRARFSPAATWQPVACHIGGAPAACARVDLHDPKAPIHILVGIGRLLHALTVVNCMAPVGAARGGRGCARVVKLDPAP